jgi:hypothetical protein
MSIDTGAALFVATRHITGLLERELSTKCVLQMASGQTTPPPQS